MITLRSFDLLQHVRRVILFRSDTNFCHAGYGRQQHLLEKQIFVGMSDTDRDEPLAASVRSTFTNVISLYLPQQAKRDCGKRKS